MSNKAKSQLQELKEMLEKSTELKDYDIDENYYLSDYSYNVYPDARTFIDMDGKFYKMFMSGDGHELVGKDDKPCHARAIYSSSMLSYNFFHWIDDGHPLKLNDICYDKVYFEVKMKVLTGSRKPANMDVVLISKDCKSMLCIESKFTEHMEALFADSYGDSGCYYSHNEYAENFIELQDIYNNYYDGIKQNICHLIALSNLKHDENALQWFKKNNPYIEQEVLDKISKDTTIKFINLLYLFDYKNNPTDKYGNSYPDLLEDFKSKLPDKLRMELLKDDRIFNSYYELFDNIKGQMPEGLSKYLGSRYFEK